MVTTALDIGPASRGALTPAAALFHSLSEPTRLAIVQRLAGGEARVVDLMASLVLPQSTVSTHVACLRDCGLVAGRPQGRQVFYRLAQPELLQLLAAAETVLSATGSAVALCPVYGNPDPHTVRAQADVD
ncbi:metalloregulator ArsR/SmtB family transcription factor [Microlunatus aurantiacus]|uniref:Metalloregulator ArsR/SmtB family transcription factor n=1 Tax=Microlunatus aurantiacus TaxID=446786 RepID=A0ABP7EEC1_9ACTN